MAKLTDLPNELLLPVLVKLSRRDISSLCRVAPRLHGICQGSLLHSVYLTNPRRQLPSLIRMFVQRPELRSSLHNFSTPVSLGHVVRVPDWSCLVTEAKKDAAALGFKKPPWLTSLHSGFVPACIGLVLVLASRLEGLDLQRQDDGIVSMECMFSRPMPRKMRLASFPFQNTLETLELPIAALDGRWLNLPKLHTLTISCLTEKYHSIAHFDQRASCTVEKLVLKCSTWVFQHLCHWERYAYAYLPRLIDLFPGVNQIHVAYTNLIPKKDHQGNPYDHQANPDNYRHMYNGYGAGFTGLIKLLEPFSSSLESLEITSLDYSELDYSPELMPIDTLRHFVNLKSLRVPHTALLNVQDFQRSQFFDYQQQPRPHPIQVLPASLETLIICGPRPKTLAWLALLLEYRHERPELKEIILDFIEDPNNTLTAFECSEEYPMIQFDEAGIRVRVRNINSKFCPINPHGNYIFGPFDVEN